MPRNPFRSEAAAFRFLLLTLTAFAAVAVAALAGGPRVAVPVWAAVSVAAVAVHVRRARPSRPLRTAPAHVGARAEHRLIVLLEQPPAGGELEALAGRADRVLVVAPAAPPRLRRWLSDVDRARGQASLLAAAAVERLRAADVEASGEVGDEDPLRAVEDALRRFGGDEIAVAAGDALAARVRERYALPVTQLAG